MLPHNELDDLPIFKNYRVFQVSTHSHDRPIQPLKMWKEFEGTMHTDNVAIAPAEKYVFPPIRGPGKIINIWFTMMPGVRLPKGINPQDLLLKNGKLNLKYIFKHLPSFLTMIRRRIRYDFKPIAHKKLYLKIYFDDEKKPTVDCPLGDFFGTGFGHYKHYWSRYLNTTAGGYVCNFHMPFKNNAKVEIVNISETHGIIAFYGAITYLKYPSEDYLKNMGYFHCKYHEEHPTTKGKPFIFLDTLSDEFWGKEGRGHLVGLVLSGRPVKPKKNTYNYLEGNPKIYIDGEESPSIEYTGTEDIFHGAWYYVKGANRKETEFYTPYHGLNFISQNKRGTITHSLWARFTKCKTSQYRFFPEGIPFEKSIKVTLHHGEFDEVPAYYDGVAYWYQEH